MSDNDLLARAAKGDAEALGALWHAQRRWLAAILLAYMPADASLDDLLQEVALIMVKRLSTLREPDALRPWLRTVAVNVARGEARSRALRLRGRPLPEDGEQLVDEVGARRLAAREQLQPVLAAARELPPKYREPLLLKALQGLSQGEIAATLDLPVTTVETRLAQARRLLRQALQPAPPGAPLRPGHPAGAARETRMGR